MSITEGALVRPTRTTRAATFRVDRIKRGGWLECTVHTYPDGTKASPEFRALVRGHWKFRVNQVEPLVGKSLLAAMTITAAAA